jgi:hypothetical protein
MSRIVLLGVVILLFVILLVPGTTRPHHTIPKIIWTYWNSEDIPDVVQSCIDSWKKHNPTFTINILSPKTVHKYIDIDIKTIPFMDGPARESDAIRLLILAKFGGILSDASVLCTKTYSFPMTSQYEVIGYYYDTYVTNPDYPVLESWFIAAAPNAKFIQLWSKAFFHLTERGGNLEEAMAYMKRKDIDFQNIRNPRYLYIYLCAQYVMQKQMTVDEIRDTMLIMKADNGPFKYLVKNDWNTEDALTSLCRGEYMTDIIKFRHEERDMLLERDDLKACIV